MVIKTFKFNDPIIIFNLYETMRVTNCRGGQDLDIKSVISTDCLME